jgi:hypothetical protein
MRLTDGEAIPLKDYANIEVIIPEEGEITLASDDLVLFKDEVRENIAFRGLEPDADYMLTFIPSSDLDNTVQQSFNTGLDISIKLLTPKQRPKSDKSYQNSRYIVGGILIGAVNLTGLLMIRKVLKE